MIRAAGPDDVAAVARLEALALGADAWSAAAVTDELAAPGRVVLVAEDAGDVVAWATTSVVADVADLLRVAVEPGHRRRGLARALLAASSAAATDRGAERMLLEVAEDNTAARALYAALGFVVLSRRRRYYADGTDALVLERDLRQGGLRDVGRVTG